MEIKKGVLSLKELLKGDRKVRLIVALGLIGMALILVSQITSSRGGQKKSGPEESGLTVSSEEYIQRLEKKLGALINNVEGVGKAQVMITLEASGETIYAIDEKTQTDRLQDRNGEEKSKVQQSENRQTNVLLVDRGSGTKQPLVTQQMEPAVKGVVVVCPGADNKVVNARVVEVITTALGVGANRVCVVKGG